LLKEKIIAFFNSIPANLSAGIFFAKINNPQAEECGTKTSLPAGRQVQYTLPYLFKVAMKRER
jgi:hypothetical protein